MTVVKSRPLEKKWKMRFDLEHRDAPELYECADDVRDTAHAGAIRSTLEDLGASAVFCVQGVPTIVLVNLDTYEREVILELHAALWNQGLASLLLVTVDDTVRAFSLSRTPYSVSGEEFERRCLVETLKATTHALELKNIIYGAESGRFWEEHSEYFQPKERIDQVLLDNLTKSHVLLCNAALSSESAQALLIQAMFIAYLEDREIIGDDYFRGAANDKVSSFVTLLKTGSAASLTKLFVSLREDFNGDLFVAPCSFEPNVRPPRIHRDHLEILARFRSGQEDMAIGQLRFWGYNFRHIPIELISAVYDRFLGEREAERRQHGAYYTPMFLADTVVSQVWDTLAPTLRDKGDFLDPACGSGVFLVRSFQRLCEHWREVHKQRTIRWDSLKNILARLRGWDLNSSAVRVAVFSLYIALLEQVSPPDIRQLIKRGKVLPELWGRTLKCQDFFSVEPKDALVDVVIGNPPWASRQGGSRSSSEWCHRHSLPMPNKEDAWAFTWKSVQHLRSDGLVAFLLPAMGFLHNHADSSIAARNLLISKTRFRRVINFADLRFQLFDGAVRPAALIILSATPAEYVPYRFEYWAPKADLNLKVKRLITLSSVDKGHVTSKTALSDPLVFKRRLRMSDPESKLFSYLSSFRKLGDLVTVYGDIAHQGQIVDRWAIGDGFKQAVPGRISDPDYDKVRSDFVGVLPHVAIDDLPPLGMASDYLRGRKKWSTRFVHRKGFEEAYGGSRILIPRGVQIGSGRLRATFTTAACTFSSIIQGLVIPKRQEKKAKLLTALLSSRVLFWFAFHGTASLGSDRPEIQKSELMRLPFPDPEDCPEPDRAQRAAQSLVSIVESELASGSDAFQLESGDGQSLTSIDQLAYEFFGLSADEVALVEDAVQYVFPAAQPSRGSSPEIWETTTKKDRKTYADVLSATLAQWFDGEKVVNVELEAANADVAILRLQLRPCKNAAPYRENNDSAVRETLSRLFENVPQRLPGNFQLIPDFRIFHMNDLYLVKPTQRRFWLRSTALSDADGIAVDLQDYSGTPKRRRHA